ncbi:MAG: hypothetical protein HY905_18265 [Deltaproteobacteria bacterium]|nr:hypothetical protein [Deltaproteobacteria bacterium]
MPTNLPDVTSIVSADRLRSACAAGATAVAVLASLCGCYMSYKDDIDGRAETGDGDAADARDDGRAESETIVEAVGDADSGEDFVPEADATVWTCPDTLPGDGPVHPALRWRRIAADEWNDLGSAALAVDGGVVLAAIPRSPAGGAAPRLVRLSATDGSPLLDGPEELPELGEATALAAVADGPEPALLLAATGPGATDSILHARLLSSGAVREVSPHEVNLEDLSVMDLRAAQDRDHAFVTAGGYGSWRWALRAVTVPLAGGPADSWTMEERPRAGSGAFVAWCPADPPAVDVAWASPLRIDLRSPEGGSLAGHFLPSGSMFVPVAAAADPATGSCDYLLAGRGDDEVVGLGMWVVRRTRFDLGLAAEHWFVDFESQVDQPNPRALEPAGALFVLAWTARRDFGEGPVPSCLYLTPVDRDGHAAGTTIRIDPGEAAARASGVGHVRLVVGADGVFVLWREAADLLLARMDLSS